MHNRNGFFELSSTQATYNATKASFIKLLDDTENKCLKLCANKYDQERNYNIGYHPAIEENKHKVAKTKKRVLEELASIDVANKGQPEQAQRSLIQYGERLGEEVVFSLFLTIFIGKLKKRWLPDVSPNTDAKQKLTVPKI
jgi:hypothetical protein